MKWIEVSDGRLLNIETQFTISTVHWEDDGMFYSLRFQPRGNFDHSHFISCSSEKALKKLYSRVCRFLDDDDASFLTIEDLKGKK